MSKPKIMCVTRPTYTRRRCHTETTHMAYSYKQNICKSSDTAHKVWAQFVQLKRTFCKSTHLHFWGFLFACVLQANIVSGQAIFSNPINGNNPSSMNPFMNGQTVANHMEAEGIGRGNGNLAVNSNGTYSLRNWKSNSLNNGKYFEFSMEPDDDYKINFVSFIYNGTISSGSANYAFRSSLDNFSSNIGSAGVSGTIDLSSAEFQGIDDDITFRLYCWGTSNNNVAIAIKNFTFNGEVVSASEPPVITTHPVAAGYCQNNAALALSVVATAGSGSIAGYQWYSNSTNSNSGGTAINGATASTYQPPVNTQGTVYYYCQVTNSEALSSKSNPAAIVISANTAGTITNTTPASKCGEGSVQLKATVSTGTIKWYEAASGGTALASGTTYNTPSLSSTKTYYAEAANGSCSSVSRTAVVATIHEIPAVTGSTPSSRCGTGTVLLAASGEGTLSWFAAASGGSALASGNTFTTPSIASSTNYYVEANNGQCVSTSRTAVTATVNALPAITGSTPNSRCGTGAVSLGASASSGIVKWYATLNGGTSLGTGTSFTSPSIATTTSYYAEAYDNNCASTSRTAVVATVKAIPGISGTSGGSRCGAGTVSLSATASAGTISWFANASGGTALGTGNAFTTPSISSNTTYYVSTEANGCASSPRTAVAASVTATPTVSSTSPSSSCGAGSKTISATPSSGIIKWYETASGGTVIASGNSLTTPHLTSSKTYYAEASDGACVSARTAVAVTILPGPAFSIAPNYCSAGGLVVLTASAGFSSYLWNTGASTNIISVDQAGVYSVTANNGAGCEVTATISVASELVTNGDFSDGNTGFSTNYLYKPDITGTKELFPEGTYSIVPDASTVHDDFNGRARRAGGGNIMVINGSPQTGATVWSQNNTTVLPNTTYYFSAWAMSVVNANNAVLQFSINGTQVGSIAYLPNGYTNQNGPFTWVRFYGQWNSGVSTTANLSIVNLNTILGGNDFALDDVSFGTLAPVQLSVNPIPNSNSGVCMENSLVLTSNASGGASPFTYTWTGPNGFSSTSANPLVTNSLTNAHNGEYSLTVRDGLGCSVTQKLQVQASQLPQNQSLTALAGTVCSGSSTSIRLSSSETGVSYQLRNASDNQVIGAEVQGTGTAIDLPTGVLVASKTFSVYAIRYATGCSKEMSTEITVEVAAKPNLVITNQAACSGTVNLTASAVTAGSTEPGTLSYFTNAAGTISLANPAAVAASGTYYIKGSSGICSDIKPVTVYVGSNPNATFSYTGSPFCSNGDNPKAILSGSAVAGVFSSTAGLVFSSTSTGEIDLSASTPGTYVVTNRVAPSGACSPVTATKSITITGALGASFSYVSNGLCQSPGAENALPVFEPGCGAGSFTSSNGLVFANASTGAVNVTASTPGNYAVINTVAANGGCAESRDTFFLRINPYTFEGAVNASASSDHLCEGIGFQLYSTGGNYQTVLLREDFEAPLTNWTTSHASVNGNTAGSMWLVQPDNYYYWNKNFRSNDRSKFYMTNSRVQGTLSYTNTILKTPQMNTIGFSNLTLDFFHFFEANNSQDIARVQVSTDNITWTDVASFTTTQGALTNFDNHVVNLNAYIGMPSLYIRFFYAASYDRYWAIDNVSVTGTSNRYTYSWQSSPSGFSSALQNPLDTASTSKFYVVKARNAYGCEATAVPVPLSVDPSPGDNAGPDKDICGSGAVSIGKPAISGRTYAWSPSTDLNNANIADPSASPTTATTYTLTETITSTGCSSVNQVNVAINTVPTITSTTPASRCSAGSVTLEAVSSSGTVRWCAVGSAGPVLYTGNSFTTPSLSTSKTYYAEPSGGNCPSGARVAVSATIATPPAIISQSTASATYSMGVSATPLVVNVNPGTGTISSYQWYSNSVANNTSGTEIVGATNSSFTPPTDVVGTVYYYCAFSNSYTCTGKSAVSGAINTLLSPVITSVVPTLPLIGEQNSGTGYRGQKITINGSNFALNSTVKFNGVAATSVIYLGANQLTAVVNNTGASGTGTVVVTNPTSGAYGSAPFEFLGYITTLPGDWKLPTTWLGAAVPVAGADVTINHAALVTTAISTLVKKLTVFEAGVLSLSLPISSLSAENVNVQGSLIWLGAGTMSISDQLTVAPNAVFTPGLGMVKFVRESSQVLFTGRNTVPFYNLSLEGGGEKQLMEGSSLSANNILVKQGTALNLNQGSKVTVSGNIELNGTMEPGKCVFEFNGLTDQELNVSQADTVVVSSMKVNKLTGTLVLKKSVQVQDSLVMVKGNVRTDANLLTIGVSAEHPGIIKYQSGHVAGKMRRWYARSVNVGKESGLFPMAQIIFGLWKNRHVQLNYDIAPSEGGHLTIEYKAEPMVSANLGTQWFISPENTGGAGFTITNFSHEGYWKIDNQAGKLIDGEYTISLSGEGYELPSGLFEITLVKRVNGGDWFCPGTHLPALGTTDIPVLSRSGVSGFSNFGYAGGSNNALPVSLISFDAECVGNTVKLNWATASETNNHQFIIEESADGENWNVVTTTDGSGNSTTLKEYQTQAVVLPSGQGYYRLTQVDFNGESETFEPVFVNCNSAQAKNEVKIYPNPASEWVTVEITLDEPLDAQLALFSNSGQVLMLQKADLAIGSNLIRLDITALPQGAYHLNISNSRNVEISGGRSIIKR